MRIVKCDYEECLHNENGECKCEELEIKLTSCFDMNPYDEAYIIGCASYE